MTVFFISDTHFGHQKINEFTHHDGSPLRVYDDYRVADMDMCEKWNDTVGSNDTVYHLGDCAFSRFGLRMFSLLNGKKFLVRGNHDQFHTRDYIDAGFKDVLGTKQFKGYWLTHAPMHEQCVREDRVKLNIHGHMHRNFVKQYKIAGDFHGAEHPKYFNACVEVIGYTPISLDEIIRRKENG